MKHTLLILTALIVAACPLRAQRHTAPVDYKLNVENFSELTVVDGVNVDYYCRPDSAGWVMFTCPPEIASKLMFNNKADHLTIQTDADETTITDVPLVRIYSASLHKVENCGDSTLCIATLVPVADFRAKQIGNGTTVIHGVNAKNVNVGITAGKGTLTIDGTTDHLTVRNVSTGPIDATALTANDVRCFMLGTGNIHCCPECDLRIYGLGSGTIYYHHKPENITLRSIGVKALAAE